MLPGRRLGRPSRNDGAALPTASAPSEAAIVWAPSSSDADSVRERAVLRMTDENRPVATLLAYDGKKQEYLEYCDAIYPHDPYRRTLEASKVYRFMFYQAMRGKKRRGGKPKPSERQQKCAFDEPLYRATMAKYEHWFESPHQSPDEPDNPVGESTIALYKTVIRNLYKEQTANRALTSTWDQIWTLPLLNLHNLVKIRRPAMEKRNYKEKFEHEFAPYEIAVEFPRIEAATWSQGQCNRSAAAWIRHRFCLLFSTTGVLRCESLYRAELSDLVGLWTKSQSDVHHIYILILQIALGTLSNFCLHNTRNPLTIVSTFMLFVFVVVSTTRQDKQEGFEALRSCHKAQECRAMPSRWHSVLSCYAF